LGPVYGKQWVDWGGTYETLLTREKDENGHRKFVKKHHPGINQIQRLIDRLNTAPDCRRMIVSAWNVGELEQMALMPCHYGFQVWTRELTSVERSLLLDEKLGQTKEERLLPYLSEMFETHNIPKREISLMWNQRSVDVGLGLPFNIASYALLLHMIAQQVNMVPGELIGNLGDTHIYTNHIDPIKEQLKRNSKTMELPKLILNKAKDIFSYKYEDFKIEGYDAHPSIKMDISI
jgi:thymidylate synthase